MSFPLLEALPAVGIRSRQTLTRLPRQGDRGEVGAPDVLLEGLPANDEDDDLPAYLRSIRATLFGGPAPDDRASDEPPSMEVDDVDDLTTRIATSTPGHGPPR